MVQSLAEALAGGPMQTGCLVFLLVIDVVCGLVIPIYETLYHLRNYRVGRIYSSKLTHWTTYWIFFGVLHLIQRVLFWFPFSYEIRVIATLLMAHPRVQAGLLIYNFLVTNPLLTIKAIDARNRLREHIDKVILPWISNYRLYA